MRGESEGTGAPAPRYAVYIIPAGPWSRLGQRWLGRDAGTGERIARLGVEHAATVDAIIETWTEAPRLYGLHATLKPPFRLASGVTFSDLDEGLRGLASSMVSFEIPMRLTRLRGFLAWGVGGPTQAVMPAPLERLANACVTDLDRFRAPPTTEETARRQHAGLSRAQADNLQRWAYPYVLDTFVFHVTLTGRLDEVDLAAAESALTRIARPDERLALQTGSAPGSAPGSAMPVNDIGLFVQAAPGLPFVIARRYGFDGSVRDGRP